MSWKLNVIESSHGTYIIIMNFTYGSRAESTKTNLLLTICEKSEDVIFHRTLSNGTVRREKSVVIRN